MSKVEIEIPDDRWFRGEWKIRPQDEQLCVVALKKIIKFPRICLFIEKENDFLDLQSMRKENSSTEKCISYSAFECNGIDRWKPLGLPADVEECIQAEIEKWFEEE